MKKRNKVIVIYGSHVAPVPNVILTEKDCQEVEESSKKIRKLKMNKRCYFSGFEKAQE